MVDRHRSISGVASELCRVVGSRALDDMELEEGTGFEDISTSSSGKEYDGLEHVTFFHSSLGLRRFLSCTRENDMRMDIRVSSDHVRHNATRAFPSQAMPVMKCVEFAIAGMM